jgi:hypothetical protein
METSQSPQQFTYDPAYIQHIVDTVNAFSDQGIYVILNLHKTPQLGDMTALSKFVPWSGGGDDFADAFYADEGPYSAREHLKQAWLELSSQFKDSTTVAGYDLLNEPHHSGTLSAQTVSDQWMKMADYIIAALRLKGDKHIAFVEPAPWETFQFMTKPLADTNVVYEMHFYRGLDMTCDPPAVANTDLDYLRVQARSGFSYCNVPVALNLPILLGEYGGMYWTAGDILPNTPQESYLYNVLSTFHEFPNITGQLYWRYEGYGPDQTSEEERKWSKIAVETLMPKRR